MITKNAVFFQVVGQGTFGIVKKAIWRGSVVAVKIIEGESARKSFAVEVSSRMFGLLSLVFECFLHLG